jgi:hypothetical protein
MLALCGLLHRPDFKINELICAYFYLCDFDRSNPLVLFLYRDVIIFTRSPEQIMMWCLNILACELDMEDVGVGRLLMVQCYGPLDS